LRVAGDADCHTLDCRSERPGPIPDPGEELIALIPSLLRGEQPQAQVEATPEDWRRWLAYTGRHGLPALLYRRIASMKTEDRFPP
jgi:hypothetical protein